MLNIKIETHNKKFIYEIDNNKGVIIYKSGISTKEGYNSIVTGRDICSGVITPDDKYLYALSIYNNCIYCYSINQLSGYLMSMSPATHTVGNNIHRLKISKSGFYLCACDESLPRVFSINLTNGSLTLYTTEMGLKILNEEIF